MAKTPFPKEQMHRIAYTELSEAQVKAALRSLHERLVADVNAGHVSAPAADLFTPDARIELGDAVRRLDGAGGAQSLSIERAPDGHTATLYARHAIRSEISLLPDCTEARMAIAQGCGVVRSSEVRLLRIDAVKTQEGWKVRRLAAVDNDAIEGVAA